MDFINQVKKLKELTKSPDVRAICESYLSGTSEMTEKEVIQAINEHTSQSVEIQENEPQSNHWDSIKKEQMEASKRYASSLMESWEGVGSNRSKNSGSYISKNQDTSNGEGALLESLKEISSSDLNVNSFVEAQGLKNLGILEAIQNIKGLSIYEYPRVKVLCEQYQNWISNKSIPEFSLIGSFIAELNQFNWDNSISPITKKLSAKASKYSREIEVSKVLEAIKNSGSASFYSDLSESLNNWLVSENKSSGLLSKEISKWSFNPLVRNLVNYLNVSESKASDSKLEIPVNAQGESSVSRIYSPILVEGESTIFCIGRDLFETQGNSLRRLGQKELNSIPASYLNLVNSVSKPHVRINENGAFIQMGKKLISLVEENEGISIYLGKSRLNFRSNGELAKILGLESASHFAVNESEVVGDILNIYTNFQNIVELDFAKNIKSKIYEGVSVNLIKWEGQIYLQRINESMRENSVYKVNGSQAVKMVKEFLRYDISEGLTEFLEGEDKLKSIMVNDRTKVLENISKVEEQIHKIESSMSTNPLYQGSKELRSAHALLNKELSILKEKWNQINIELSNVDSTPISSDELLEDEKFSIGDYIKVKESGETGKIISVDGTSGRYTVLLDNGKTSDFLVNEIVDLEEALSKAAEDNKDSSDEDGGEEVKESNNFNKSDLSEDQQKDLLKAFADSHSFSKAPKGENEKIEMELDGVHGYNLTVNEKAASKKEAKGNDTYAKAPGNDKMSKGKVEGEDLLDDNAPETKDKTDFEGEDADGNKYDIGYNVREGEGSEGNMVEAPESGKNAKETKFVKNLSSFMNLAKAPGKEGDVDFEVNDEMGYNIQESDDLKKN